MGNLECRKASKKIRFVDSNGKPLSEKTINVELANHEFLFGWGAFDFLSYIRACKKEDDSISLLKKIEIDVDPETFFKDRITKWLEIFNYGTLPFYWGGFEKIEGKPDTENLRLAAELLKKNNVTVKGHPLCWHTACAKWLLDYDEKTILEKQLGRIQREVEGFRGLIDYWDVINEVVIMPVFKKENNAITKLCKKLGRVGIVKATFDQAVKYNPNGTFLINDFNLSQKYVDLIEECLEAGVPITAIGLQSHQHQGYWGVEKIEETLKRFEQFNLPIHFTENTITSGPIIPARIKDLNDWHFEDDCSTPELEERQKNQLEEWYRTIFEGHPLVKAITGWDFTDGMWLNAPSGLLHKDGSKKPVFDMLKNLIKNEWHTKEEVNTDKDGFAVVEGFKGEYNLQCKTDNVQLKGNFVLSDNTKEESEIILSK